MIDKETIKQIALETGFKLKEQPDGSMDLNPYVYTFARVLETQVRKEIIDKETIKQIALETGFKLKEQPDGSMDLNPYVYTFARVLETQVRKEIIVSMF